MSRLFQIEEYAIVVTVSEMYIRNVLVKRPVLYVIDKKMSGH